MEKTVFSRISRARIACVVISIIALSSCVDKDQYGLKNEKEEVVTLGNYFDFATRQKVKLNINYGEECPKAYFEVYAENPLEYNEEGSQIKKKEGIEHIASGFADASGIYNKEASLPASVSEIYIYSPDFGVPTLFKTNIADAKAEATITFDNALDITAVTRSTQTRANANFIKAIIPNVLGDWNTNNGRPNYLNEAKKIAIDKSLKDYMNFYFPEEKNNAGNNLVSENADILIKKDAHVTINYFGGTTDAKSVFAYYCYSENATNAEIKVAAQHACVIFPNAHSNSLGVYSGVAVDLKYINEEGVIPSVEPDRFPAGTKIGFLIWNNGWKGENAKGNLFYSTKFLNSTGISHTAIFAAQNNKGDKFNIITMEDWKKGTKDYNDVAFIISSDPITAIEVPDVPNPGDRKGTDSYCGLLGFEDNWPEQGDYDMNDVVMKYQSKVDYNNDNKILNIIDKFTLSWTGANYHNSFAYEVPFDLSGAEVKINGSVSASHSSNVITLFTDAKTELGVSAISADNMASQDIQEKTYTVSIQFNNPTIDKSEVVVPYNPFIKVSGSATEVHLTDHKPTATANNRFPSGADIATGDGKYFICKDGYPFAIHMDARLDKSLLELDLKKEGIRIDNTYPKFNDWAKTRDPKLKWW